MKDLSEARRIVEQQRGEIERLRQEVAMLRQEYAADTVEIAKLNTMLDEHRGEIARLKAELNEAICIIDRQRKTFERLLAEKADAQKEAGLLRQFTKWADQGYCPALVFDDNGHWAVSFDGCAAVNIGDEPEDSSATFFIGAQDWRNSVPEAIEAAIAAIEKERHVPANP